MTDNVIISIKGTQVSAEGGPDEMELVTAGVLNQEGEGRYTISYEESELTGLEGTTTVVRVDGPRVTLLREGSINSQMVFEEGRRHLSMYNTPYGALAVGSDVITAFYRMESLELWAKITINAIILGGSYDISRENVDKLIGLRKYYRITGRHPGYKKYPRREHGEPTDK